VPQSDVPGEKTSLTQPFPTKPAPFDRQGVSLDDLIDFTPELRAEAVKIAAQYKIGPLFTPPIVAGTNGLKGTLVLPAIFGGANWQGAAVDVETGMLYVSSLTSVSMVALMQDSQRSKMNYVMAGRSGAAAGRGQEPPRAAGDGLGPQGLPLTKPPYGRITAIDLNTGEHVWMVPNGDTPDSIKNHPALKGVDIGKTGTPERAGLMVTKTLLFAGEGGAASASASALGGGGPMFRALDKKTGEMIWEYKLPARQTGIPMTYLVNGQQYIVVPAAGRGQPAELIALRLP
jgi:quinoprotein glucose dehydrogenase